MDTEDRIDYKQLLQRFETIILREFPETQLDIDWEKNQIKVNIDSCSALVTFTKDGQPEWSEYTDSMQSLSKASHAKLRTMERQVNELFTERDTPAESISEITDCHHEAGKEIEGKRASNNQIEQWMHKYGGLLTRHFPRHLIEEGWNAKKLCISYSVKARRMYVQYTTMRARVTFTDQGRVIWDQYDDGDYDTKSYGRYSCENFFSPIIDAVNERYYSDEPYEEDAKRFVTEYKAGKYQYTGSEQLKGCIMTIIKLIIFGLFVAWAFNL